VEAVEKPLPLALELEVYRFIWREVSVSAAEKMALKLQNSAVQRTTLTWALLTAKWGAHRYMLRWLPEAVQIAISTAPGLVHSMGG
jgi:hypothetical protein